MRLWTSARFAASLTGRASQKIDVPPGIIVSVTRDDVHAGDPAEPTAFPMPAGSCALAILRRAADPNWLPTIYESVVAWSIISNVALAVVEHDCRLSEASATVMPLDDLEERLHMANWDSGVLRLHFNYQPKPDTQTLFEALQGSHSPP